MEIVLILKWMTFFSMEHAHGNPIKRVRYYLFVPKPVSVYIYS